MVEWKTIRQVKQVQSMIKVEHLRKVYRTGKEKVLALADINLELAKGEFCCIVGASGSGKSTLLNQLAGLEKPTRGTVMIDGQNISAMSENQLAAFRQQKLGFVFQSYNLLPTMTAVENVALPLMFKGIPKRKREKLAKEQLKKMGLGKRAHHKPTEMSGGQQQRVGIARAFVSRPAVIFADEPTGNLDSHTTVQVMNAILKLIRENNITFVMVTHERDLAACADRIITLRDGLVLRDEKMEHPQQAYVAPEGQEDADLDDNSWEDGTGKLASPPPLRQEEKKEEKTAEATPPLPGRRSGTRPWPRSVRPSAGQRRKARRPRHRRTKRQRRTAPMSRKKTAFQKVLCSALSLLLMAGVLAAVPAGATEGTGGGSSGSGQPTPEPTATQKPDIDQGGSPVITAYTVQDASGKELQRIEEGQKCQIVVAIADSRFTTLAGLQTDGKLTCRLCQRKDHLHRFFCHAKPGRYPLHHAQG